MRPSKTLVALALAILPLAAIAAAIGAFWTDAGAPISVINAHGETVTLIGRGLYRYDTALMAAGFQTQDGAVLLVGLPALVLGLFLYRRGSFRGSLLFAGALAYLFYDYLSLAIGAAYNPLLLIYIALLALSLVALLLALTGIHASAVPATFSTAFPRRGIALYFGVVGVAFWILWAGLDLVPALFAGQAPPVLAHYTTIITYVLDMGLLTPLMITTAVLLARRSLLGDVAASVLLVFSVLLNIQLAAMGVVQYVQGLMGLGAFIAFSISFNVLALIAVAYTIRMLRSVRSDPSPA